MKSNSLRAHFIKTQAANKAARANADPRLSAQILGRRTGTTMVSQSTPVSDAPSNDDENPDTGSNIELKFWNDDQQLSNIQSISHKTELKKEFLPFYIPWIEGTIAEGVGSQDDMLVKLMVWCLDTHEFKTAVDIAAYALLNDFVMPEPFTRDVATVFVEQLAEEMLSLEKDTDVSVHADLVQRAIEVTTSQDMPDQVRAKLYRVLGDSLKDAKPDDAINAYKIAIKLDDKVGCKKDLAQLEKAGE
ncbi:phage terminase small subunit [Psychrobacter sp. KCTC 72983]|uniref:phage terminase small subunit n=1 Tax=Psychrobacter sp. KCTC 72983 TaxID=2733866 RepID=UPI001647F80D|nr:phage terminase small subunit [Psychrobacter sp. KCTC 72983]